MTDNSLNNLDNVPESTGCSPNVLLSGENSSDAFKRMASQKNTNVPPCSPIDSQKEYIEKPLDLSVKSTLSKEEKNIYRNNNRAQRGNRGTNSDPRWQCPEFKQAVRTVMSYLGKPTTMGSFRELDGQVDWYQFSDEITHPVFGIALCTFSARDEMTYPQYIQVRGLNQADAKQHIPPRYKFIRWFTPEQWLQEIKRKGGRIVVKCLPENKAEVVIG
jgi:hypothetical protein